MTFRSLSCLAALALPAAAAQALTPADVAVLAGPCAACHGPDGQSPGAIPAIAGRAEEHLATRMFAFRDGQDPAATVMPRLMKGYDEAQIRALAKWFAEGRQ